MAAYNYSMSHFICKNIHNILLKRFNLKHEIRLLSTNAKDIYSVEKLNNRSLICVTGNEVAPFMQGLITNDMKHLEEGAKSMYTMFLNSKGRVMYDAIIYKDSKVPAVYIECDKLAVNDLQRHLKMFKVRRKINIDIIDNYKIWVIYSPRFVDELTRNDNIRVKDILQENVVPCQGLELYSTTEGNDAILESFSGENLLASTDPRLSALGVRILAEDKADVKNTAVVKGVHIEDSKISYKNFRYALGIAEGMEELPYGKCFPLEMNCDYLHGVSFHKGCYIGQELTARTHHTGVVRKRLMPIYLDSTVQSSNQFQVDAPIEVEDVKRRAIGKLRGIENNMAIGLVRISDALSAAKLNIGNLTGFTVKPQWWPREAPKENLSRRS